MKKIFTAAAAFGQAFFLFPLMASAQVTTGIEGANSALNAVGGNIGGGVGSANSLPTLVGKTINVFLGVLGIIFVILVVYAGFLYLIDQGKEDNVKKAKKLLTNAIIGLVIVVAAYAISNFVIDALTASVT